MVEAQEPVSEGDPKPFSKVHATSIYHIDDHEAYNILELEFHSFCSRNNNPFGIRRTRYQKKKMSKIVTMDLVKILTTIVSTI